MVIPTKEEFQKLSSQKRTDELFSLVQNLFPLLQRMDSLTDTVSSLAERMNHLEAKSMLKHTNAADTNNVLNNPETGSNPDSDSMYKSLTSLGGGGQDATINNKPDPFIIKRSKEINR